MRRSCAAQKLLRFPVRMVLPAIRAELLHFDPLSGRLLVFRARIVPVLAFLTLERDDFSWHLLPLFSPNPESR